MSDIRARIARKLQEERGIALIIAMGVLLAMSVALTGVIYFTSTNTLTASYDKQGQSAVSLAEAGLNNALAVVMDPVNEEFLNDPTWLTSPRTTTFPGGTVTWSGELRQCEDTDPSGCDLYWLITGTAKVTNPTGPTQDIQRTMTIKAPIKGPPETTESLEIWNWVYTHRTGFTCDMTIDQSVAIQSPLYVRGNLCMRSTSTVVGGPFVVGGNLMLVNPQNGVGTSAKPVTDPVRIGGWCQYKNLAIVNKCEKEPHIPNTNIYATNFSHDTAEFGITLPQVYWWKGDSPNGSFGWYEKASPGPMFRCTTSSGTTPTFEVSGDTIMNNNVPGIFNLTPSGSSYTCITRRGQLSWNHLSKTLTLRGTIFIDGSVEINNGNSSASAPAARYVQQPDIACTTPPQEGDKCSSGAVLYVGGTIAIKNTKLCGKVDSTGKECDQTGWDPNINLFVVSAYSQGGQCPSDTSICVVSSSFQGGMYGRFAIDASTTSKTQGPLVSETEVKVGQTNGVDFPDIRIVPIGMPGYGPEFYSTLDPEYG
jgi:hypothetical protein